MKFFKRYLGLGFIIIGIFVLFAGKIMTGAVIGFSRENLLGMSGLLVFIIGSVLLLLGAVEEERESKNLGKR